MRRRATSLCKKPQRLFPVASIFLLEFYVFIFIFALQFASHDYTGMASMRLEGVFVGTIRVS